MKQIIWDDYRMILQTGDAGDTAANIGTYHIFCESRRRMIQRDPYAYVVASLSSDGLLWRWREKVEFEDALEKLKGPAIGLYRRHPAPEFWGSHWGTMSRDQTIPLLGAMALYGMKRKVFEYVVGHALRGFLFTTNIYPNWAREHIDTPEKFGWGLWKRVRFFFGWRPGYPVFTPKMPDFTGPSFWALELRGLYHWAVSPLLFPILCLLDLQLVVSSYSKVKRYAKDPHNSDDRNHINLMLVGLQVCSTPLVKWAAKVYSKRPLAEIPPGVYNPFPELQPEAKLPALPSGPQSALDHYYRAPDSPPFNILGRPLIEEYFE